VKVTVEERVATQPGRCPLCGDDRGRFLFRGRDYRFGHPQRFAVKKCEPCDLVYLSPRPTAEGLLALYAQTYVEPDRPPPDPFRWMCGSILQSVWARCSGSVWYDTIPARGRVLDVGCLRGDGMMVLKKRGLDVQGLEPSPPAAEAAREKGLRVTCGDLQTARLAEGSFDTVLMSQVLEHVADPVADLTEARRILRPEGLIWIACPNLDSLSRRIFGRFWAGFHIPYHLYSFTPSSLRKMLAQARFALLRLETRTPQYWVTISAAAVLVGLVGAPVPNKASLFLRIMSAPIFRLADAFQVGDCLVALARKI
jgi:SAM-dependent methyltransferase